MSVSYQRGVRSCGPWLLTIGLLVGASGCRRAGEIVLHQPFAPPKQSEMTLKSRWAYYATDAGRQGCLLAFPRPGSEHGPRDFLVYIDAPDAPGTLSVDAENPGTVRGFLIQTVGDLRGKARITKGAVRFRNVLLQPELRRIDLDLRCEDDTRITGSAYLENTPHELNAFRRRYAGDIAALAATATAAEASAAETEPRGNPSP